MFASQTRLDNYEATRTCRKLDLACGNCVTVKAGKCVVLTEGECSAVKVHNLISHIAVAGKGVNRCIFRKVNGSLIGKGVVDYKVAVAILAILTGVSINVCALGLGSFNVIAGVAHKTLPEQNCKVIGSGIKAAVLKEAVVRGSKGVVEDNTVGKGDRKSVV